MKEFESRSMKYSSGFLVLSWIFAASFLQSAFAYDVVIIGNSITFHAPRADIGWDKNNGMAASAPEYDYAHIFLKEIGINSQSAYIRGFYPFETDSTGAKNNIESMTAVFASHPKISVIQLGDNIKIIASDTKTAELELKVFSQNYSELLDKAASASQLVLCVSTWWKNDVKDVLIKSTCESKGGRYVFIGDIYTAPTNPDIKTKLFSNSGVDSHPKNWGMNEIAKRLAAKVDAGVIPR